MKTSLIAIAALVLWATSGATAQVPEAGKAFDHYDAIRAALAADTLKGIPEHAAALAPLAAAIGGVEAKKSAELLGKAADLKGARQQFGPLSAALLPAFGKAAIPDVYFYNCSMVKQSWAQRGKAVENPYMGKGMLACGVPVKPSQPK